MIQVPISMPIRELLDRVGILAADRPVPDHLRLFIVQADAVLRRLVASIESGATEAARGAAFQQLLVDACGCVLCHPIVADNRYLCRFAEGVSESQARHECQQFSVFALQFDVAQAKLVANAPTEEAYLERLRVLLNEKGIPYADGFDGELTGRWQIETVHFSWLRTMAAGLGLRFEDIGKVWVGLPGTLAFVNATFENYAHVDQNIAAGAAFAIENWAANSLWKPWIAGMEQLNASRATPVDLGYLKYHDLEEEHHSQATLDELLENFFEPWFDAERFLEGAQRMLTEGVQAYYVSQLATMPDRDDSWPATACADSCQRQDLPRVVEGSLSVSGK